MNGNTLAIDAGNSRIKWGVHDGRNWRLRGAALHAECASGHVFRDLQNKFEIDWIVVSNVAGDAVARLIKLGIEPFGKPASFISAQARQCGVTNGYENPQQLGSDRWAALVGAHAASAGLARAQLVVMCGTALTIDALDSGGEFLGGIIVPGLQLMQLALNQGTAQLPASHGDYQGFPTNTASAMSSGAVEACAGAVARMFARLSEHAAHVPRCVCSGGSVHFIAPHLSFPVSINDNLVLEGLLVIARTVEFQHS